MTKDEIHFHTFLNAYRKMRGISMVRLTRGIYSKSQMWRVENGERLPRKLTRDRLVARLGISGEYYEDYLSLEEYADWTLRREILGKIEERDLFTAWEMVTDYSGREDFDCVERQFADAVKFMCLKLTKAPRQLQRERIASAVSHTMGEVGETFPKGLILSAQEVNLLIEYVSLHEIGENEEEQREWKFLRYLDIIGYINRSCMDDFCKSKIYTKVVCYICKDLDRPNLPMEELRKCLTLCESAIDILRKSRRLYYLVELLEWRMDLIERLGKTEEEKENYADAKRWHKMLCNLYREYEISPYMEDFVYLYEEAESYSTNQVIRIRRKMFHKTQEQLAGDICDVKTVRRTEHCKYSPQMYVVRGLFGNLGLCPEYVRARVIAKDPKAFELKNRLSYYSNMRSVTEWEETISELEGQICMDILHNQQALGREKILLKEYKGELSKEEVIAELKKVLCLTVNIDLVNPEDEMYFTIEEINLIYNIATRMDADKDNRYFKILWKHYREGSEKGKLQERIMINDLVLTGLASYLGNNGEEEKSTSLSNEIILENLKNRRARTLARNLYNNGWNEFHEKSKEELAENKSRATTILQNCILLSEIICDDYLKTIFENKLTELKFR